MSRSTLFFLALSSLSSNVLAQSPFQPPRASMHYAPDRTCDLTHLQVDIDVDYAARAFKGTTVNTLSPLRNGLKEIVLHAGAALQIKSLKVDGRTANFVRSGTELHITVDGLTKGKPFKVTIEYSAANSKGTGFGSGGGGWHWILPENGRPDHVGFWTQGESAYNCEWAPTWDYPNDLATSEVRCTVQADWDVLGNGELVSNTLSADKTRRTFDWKMTQPHATYLLSLYGGPFAIKKDTWNGVHLWYVVPKSDAAVIDDSFGNTKDMMAFFSGVLGVKYPWNK